MEAFCRVMSRAGLTHLAYLATGIYIGTHEYKFLWAAAGCWGANVFFQLLVESVWGYEDRD